MLVKRKIGLLLFVVLFAFNASAQDIMFYFSAGDFSGEPDNFNNTHKVTPDDAIDPRLFGNEELLDVFFDEDNLWLKYQEAGNVLLVSHGPGFWEDAPELTMEITVAMAGKYEVIFNFLDSRDAPDTGPIQAALGGEDLVLYSHSNSIEATGGTAPGYPTVGGETSGSMFWHSVVLGEVEADAGGVVKVRVDDTPGDEFNLPAEGYVTSTFQGVTLRVLELSGSLSEVQVNPGAYEWTTDISGNQFRTWAQDEAAYPNLEDWLTVDANSGSDSLWNVREGLGPYGPIIESFPPDGDDAPPLKTSVIFAQGGTYKAYLNIGDTGASTPEDNLTNPTPLVFGFEGEDLITYHPNDGEFKGTPGYNDYEISLGEISVQDGEERHFIIDDAIEYEGVQRTVYLGMRFELQVDIVLDEFQVSPGVTELYTDLGGNQYMTWAQDEAAYPNLEDWLTIDANSETDNLWNVREGLGPYGPIIESFPQSDENAPPLRTRVIFSRAGTYDVYLNVGDIAASDPEENLESPTPLMFGFEGGEMTTYHPNDGVFNGTPGYNDYEMSIGQITVEAGEERAFIIDDAVDYEGAERSVYLGMRFSITEGTAVESWSLY
jgi:hypothetical protein